MHTGSMFGIASKAIPSKAIPNIEPVYIGVLMFFYPVPWFWVKGHATARVAGR